MHVVTTATIYELTCKTLRWPSPRLSFVQKIFGDNRLIGNMSIFEE